MSVLKIIYIKESEETCDLIKRIILKIRFCFNKICIEKDFVFTNAEDYVFRKYIPQEVAVFLDKVIKQRKAIQDD